jgi:4-diphosphocytidyl-2-C-methyl-D-erythritol kinase
MVAFPHCKINLGLNVIRKRNDGYHDIVTCFYPVPVTDVVEIIPSEHFSFSVSGDSIPGNQEENLCVKAFTLVSRRHPIPCAKIHLHKAIPAGAGLGGGSSDAAFVLRTLNEIFDLKLDKPTLERYASDLGSDCPFFLQDRPKIGRGRGNELTDVPLTLKGNFLVLVKPQTHVSTAEAYADISPAIPELTLERVLTENPVHEWKQLLKNDFENTILEKFPEIGQIKRALYQEGALYASMSGSGSSVYGIFRDRPALSDRFHGMYLRTVKLQV